MTPVRQADDNPLLAGDEMKSAAPISQRMQRVKVGLVGLAAVVLLIGLASAIFSAASRERPTSAAGTTSAAAAANITIGNTALPAAEADEPLADLGVAPSAKESPRPALEK